METDETTKETSTPDGSKWAWLSRLRNGEKTIPKEETKTKRAESFVLRGLESIKSGDYQAAIDHFRNKDKARELGLTYRSEDAKAIQIMRPVQEGDIRYLQDELAKASKVDLTSGTIKPSSFFPVIFENGKEVVFEVPTELRHEEALLQAEEWLHGVQYLNEGKTLTGAADVETDIAIYLHNNDVPMTEAFLDRYGRREAIQKLEI